MTKLFLIIALIFGFFPDPVRRGNALKRFSLVLGTPMVIDAPDVAVIAATTG